MPKEENSKAKISGNNNQIREKWVRKGGSIGGILSNTPKMTSERFSQMYWSAKLSARLLQKAKHQDKATSDKSYLFQKWSQYIIKKDGE